MHFYADILSMAGKILNITLLVAFGLLPLICSGSDIIQGTGVDADEMRPAPVLSLDSILKNIQELRTTNPSECINECAKGMQLAEQENNDSIKAEIMLVKARALYSTGQYEKSLKILLELENISKKRGDEILRAKALLNQGNIYWFNKSYYQALDYYNEAYQIGDIENNNEVKGWALNNIGLIHEYLQQSDSALVYMLKAQGIRVEEKDTAHIYSGYYNIGSVYQSLGEYELANSYMLKAIEDDGRYIPIVEYGHYLIHIGDGYRQQNKHAEAEFYLLKGIAICESINSIYSLELGNGMLSEVYAAQGKYLKAYEYLSLANNLKDTLYNKQMSEELTKLKLNHEAEKKEKEIALLRLEKELAAKEAKRKGFRGKIYLALSILFGIILLLVYRQINTQKIFNIKLQEQVKLKTRELKSATDKAVRANNLKTEFLKNMSHEVRTPLNAIHGFSSLLSETIPFDKETNSYLKTIESSTDVLLEIFDDMLELSRIENGDIQLSMSPVNLSELLKVLITKQQQALELRKDEFILLEFIEPDLSDLNDETIYLVTDEKYLQLACSKLLDNAAKFTECGFVKTGYTINPDSITIYVKDTGIGIALDQQDEIFDKFTKLENSNNKLYGGPGLGLTLSKLIVEKLGGKIWLESEVNKGSTFFIKIPSKA